MRLRAVQNERFIFCKEKGVVFDRQNTTSFSLQSVFLYKVCQSVAFFKLAKLYQGDVGVH